MADKQQNQDKKDFLSKLVTHFSSGEKFNQMDVSATHYIQAMNGKDVSKAYANHPALGSNLKTLVNYSRTKFPALGYTIQPNNFQSTLGSLIQDVSMDDPAFLKECYKKTDQKQRILETENNRRVHINSQRSKDQQVSMIDNGLSGLQTINTSMKDALQNRTNHMFLITAQRLGEKATALFYKANKVIQKVTKPGNI